MYVCIYLYMYVCMYYVYMRHCKIAPLHQLDICHNVTVDNTYVCMYVCMYCRTDPVPAGLLARDSRTRFRMCTYCPLNTAAASSLRRGAHL